MGWRVQASMQLHTMLVSWDFRVETTFRRAVVLLIVQNLFSEFVVPCDGCFVHLHWLLLSWFYLSVVHVKISTSRRVIELTVQNICNSWLYWWLRIFHVTCKPENLWRDIFSLYWFVDIKAFSCENLSGLLQKLHKQILLTSAFQ